MAIRQRSDNELPESIAYLVKLGFTVAKRERGLYDINDPYGNRQCSGVASTMIHVLAFTARYAYDLGYVEGLRID